MSIVSTVMLRAHNLAQTDQVIQGVFARRLPTNHPTATDLSAQANWKASSIPGHIRSTPSAETKRRFWSNKSASVYVTARRTSVERVRSIRARCRIPKCRASHACSLANASRLPIFSTTWMRSSCAARGVTFPLSHLYTESVDASSNAAMACCEIPSCTRLAANA